jgi:starch-binding outer membrane protein, SusD/RagB family
MKSINFKIAVVGLVIIITATIASCDKKLDQTNPNSLTIESYFKTSAEIQKGTNSIYSVMKSFQLVSREWFFVHDTRSDEMSTGGSQLEAPRAQMLNGNTDASNPLVSAVWSALYVMIHRANTVIANSGNGTDNPTLTARAVGEAKFLRAWAYNELVSMWGPVPLITAPVTAATSFSPRVKEDDVYAAIIKDLQDAATALPGKSGYAPADRGRATNASANALLGRVLMQKGDYTGAKTALLKIPTTGADGYQLMNRYLDNFEEESELNNESIFEVIFYDKGNNDFNWGSGIGDGSAPNLTTVRNQEYNAVAWRNLIPSNKYLANFEHTAQGAAKTDPRLSFSVYQSGDLINNGTELLTDAMQNGSSSILNGVVKKISWRKNMLTYKENSGFHPGGNNERIMRYAEVLINLAECEAELNNFSAVNGAAFYLNQVRGRASVAMPAYPTAQYPVNDKTNTIRAIMHEKMAEMGCESIRNVDIMRWRKKGYFGADPLAYFRAGRDELLPLPQAEVDNNPQLGSGGIAKQNPGY